MPSTKENTHNCLLLSGVTKRYGRGTPVFAALNYQANPGTATGLVGPNGSGKTTLLRLLSVVSYPTTGHILYRGESIHDSPYRYLVHVGVVEESGDLPLYLNAVELLEWIARSKNRYDETTTDRIEHLLDRLGLDERRNNLIGTYSSGMIKKTQIAAAVIADPAILLLDEPFRGLDGTGTTSTLELLISFVNKGGIIFVSSHIKSTLETICSGYIEF